MKSVHIRQSYRKNIGNYVQNIFNVMPHFVGK